MTFVRMTLVLLIAVMTASGAMAGDHVPTVLPSGLEELWQGGVRCDEPTAEQWILTLQIDYRTAALVAGEAKVIPYRFVLEDLVAAVQAQVEGTARLGGAGTRQRSPTRKTSTETSANIFGFTGHEMDPETGLVYMKGRYYDPEIGRFLTEDPAIGDPSVPPSLHKYLYAYANPTFYVDPDGEAVESIWDAISLGVGLASLGYNLYHGNLRDAGVDTIGVLADSAALALPFVPGGAGAAIKASRAGTATAQQLNRARQVTRGVDTVQAVDQAVNVVDSTARASEALDEGSFGEAAFNAGVAALGTRGTVANTGAARSGRYFDDISNPRGPPSGPMILTESSDRVGVKLEPMFPRGRDAPSATSSYRPGDRLPDGRIAGAGPGAALRDGPDFDTARRLSEEQSRDALGQWVAKSSPGQRIPGISAVDDFERQALDNGFEIVGREISVNTPFGLRRYDVVLKDPETKLIHGIEIKSSQAAFDKFDRAARQQFAADRWLNSRKGAEAVGEGAGLWIENATKVLWELK